MAIYIRLNRTDDGPDFVLYEFGWVEEVLGTVALDKRTGEIEILDFTPDRGQEYFESRVRQVLAKHHAARTYPAETRYIA